MAGWNTIKTTTYQHWWLCQCWLHYLCKRGRCPRCVPGQEFLWLQTEFLGPTPMSLWEWSGRSACPVCKDPQPLLVCSPTKDRFCTGVSNCMFEVEIRFPTNVFKSYQLNSVCHSVHGEGFLSELMEDFVGVRSFFTTFQKQSIPTGDCQSGDLKHNVWKWAILQETIMTVVASEIPCPSSWMLTDLRETVRTWLEDDKQNANGHCDLFQLQVVGHPRPPQHPTHAVLRGHSQLTEANGETVQLGRWQTQAVDQSLGKMTCGELKQKQRIKAHPTSNTVGSEVLYVQFCTWCYC